MRFSIRDMFWLVLAVAIGLGWSVSYKALDGKRLEAVQQAHRQRTSLADAKLAHNQIDMALRERESSSITIRLPVDWSVPDEPNFEP